jgi:hypothetical protein
MDVSVAAPINLYVSPQGNDMWSGRRPAPSPNRQDGPFATLSAAVEAARQARKRSDTSPATVNLWLRGGTYVLARPLELTVEDSGADAKHPFTIASYRNEKTILSGGQPITGWSPTPGRPGIWQAEVPEVREGRWYFRSLFVNGRRAVRARTPNAGSFFTMQGERFSDKPARFRFRPGDIKPAWANEPDAEVVAFEKWIDFRQHIRSVSVESNVVELSSNAAPHTHESGARYFVENTADSLDAPGEWQLNRQSGIVRYFPLIGEDLTKSEVIAPRLPQLVILKGDVSAKTPIRHLVLRGLTFNFTDWTIPDDGYTDSQAAVRIRGDLSAEAATDCVIEDCTFSHLNGYAIDFGRGCQGNKVIGNDIFDIGAGGIRLGEPGDKLPDVFTANHSHLVTDNHLHALGRIYAPAVGVLILQSSTNRVAHNHIHDLYYTAVSVGWNWGYQETPCRENVIEFNHMHDIGQSMLSDMGAVYTLGIQRGTVVRNNVIHDVNSFTYGGWGLYPDEGSTDIIWENNVVYRTKSAGFHQHYGRENIVRNNIFAFGREHQLMRTREEPHVSFLFTNNIVYFDSGTLLGSSWKNERFVMEKNLYFDARADALPEQMKFAGATLAQWRSRGHDTNSLIADPLFVAPEKNDFRLKRKSPAFKLGFKPIDVSTVGVHERR